MDESQIVLWKKFKRTKIHIIFHSLKFTNANNSNELFPRTLTHTHPFQIYLIKMHKLSGASMFDKSNSCQHKKKTFVCSSIWIRFFSFRRLFIFVCFCLFYCLLCSSDTLWILNIHILSYSYRSVQVKRRREWDKTYDFNIQHSQCLSFMGFFCFCCVLLIQTIDSFEMLHFFN